METGSGVVDLTVNPSDEVSVAAGTATDLPSEEEVELAMIEFMNEELALLTKKLPSFTSPPPSTPKDVSNTSPSPTLGQAHSNFNSKLAELSMSPIEGPPPGMLPLLISTGKSLLNAKLAELEELPPILV